MQLIDNHTMIQQALAFGDQYGQFVGDPLHLSDSEYQALMLEHKNQYEKSGYHNKMSMFVNIKTNKIEAVYNSYLTLGWKSDEWSVEAYFNRIHPEYIAPYLHWSMAVYQLGFELGGTIKPMASAFQLSVPIKHASGEYYWCLMTAYPTRVDANGQMTDHLNTFQKLEKMTDFNRRVLEPYLLDHAEIAQGWTFRIRQKMKVFATQPLSENELKTLKLASEEVSTLQIAKQLGVAKDTVMGYKKNILRMGSNICGRVFRDAEEVGRFYKAMDWI
jgi:DNA-binding CsgD family transcriptional regulator